MPPSWRIYYSDGSTFDDTQGQPYEAPKNGVQVILVRHGKKSRRVLKTVDYYVWSPTLEKWLDCVDSASALLRAMREPWVVILSGEYIEEARFEEILIEAQNEADFLGG